jgi:hypothetical protein
MRSNEKQQISQSVVSKSEKGNPTFLTMYCQVKGLPVFEGAVVGVIVW